MLCSKCKVPIIEYSTEQEEGKTTSHVRESIEQSRSEVAELSNLRASGREFHILGPRIYKPDYIQTQ